MITYHNNGEFWYQNNRSIWKRVRRWVVWCGGWETYSPDGRDGWRFRIPRAIPAGFEFPAGVKRPSRWLWMDPTPVSLFGHRITFFGWGWNMRVRSGVLVYVKRTSREDRQLYISTNGTPTHARCWVIGAPREVRDAVAQRQIERELGRVKDSLTAYGRTPH